MHALSSDTRVIFVMTTIFSKELDDDFDYELGLGRRNEEPDQDAVNLHERLSQMSYVLPDSKVLAVVDIVNIPLLLLLPPKY